MNKADDLYTYQAFTAYKSTFLQLFPLALHKSNMGHSGNVYELAEAQIS